MKDLILHAKARQAAERYVAALSHALIISGPTGSGKTTLAKSMTEQILGLDQGKLQDYPYALTVIPEEGKSSISIEAVRQLEHFLSLKVPGKGKQNRAVIIEDAHLLTVEAQNALLKLLEEPPEGTVMILTAASEQALLPTIRSRSQTLKVTKPTGEQVNKYFAKQGFNEKDIKQAYAISGGLPGLMHSLLNDENHPLMEATEWARRLLSQSMYERLLSVDELSKKKDLAAGISFILQQMAHVSLQTATGQAAQKWQSVLAASYQASEALSASAQPKLVLTNLMLHL